MTVAPPDSHACARNVTVNVLFIYKPNEQHRKRWGSLQTGCLQGNKSATYMKKRVNVCADLCLTENLSQRTEVSKPEHYVIQTC